MRPPGPVRRGLAGYAAPLVFAAIVAGCADDPPPPPRAPIVVETVTYQPGAAPPVVEQTTTILREAAPAQPVAAPRAVAPAEPPSAPEPEPEPFVPSSVRVEGRWVLQFQAGMARPTKVSGVDPRSTKRLGDDDVVFVQGIIEVDGRFTRCRIIRGAGGVDDEVLSAVKTWRVTPIVFHGKPTAVLYTWPVHVQGP